ncbi:hypothetical protein D3C71_1668290 [compost metagenome]
MVAASAAVIVVRDDVSQYPAGSGAAQGKPRVAVRQQCAGHTPQASADDRIAPLLVGQCRRADAQRQNTGENSLNQSFGDRHDYSPKAGRSSDAAMHA